ncbi:MAG: hypothetical protein P1R58_05045 [bacterium]|nr:hypothetical protein [bacterium]
MNRVSKLALLGLICLIPISASAITKVAARYNSLEFFGGFSTPVGNYHGYRSGDWYSATGQSPAVTASDLYESTWHVGFAYGQLRNDHVLYTIGFTFTDVKWPDSTIIPQVGIFDPPLGYGSNLYDIDFDLNYYQNNVARSSWSPFVGLGFHGGFYVFSMDGVDPQTGFSYASETEIKFAMSVNFGFDIRVAEMENGRGALALSSTNSYDFLGTGNRPRYLNFGLGLKYYFRP